MYSSIVRAGMAKNMLQEVVWFEHPRVENSERLYQEIIAKRHSGLEVVGTRLEPSSMTSDALTSIQQARGLIDTALNQPVPVSRVAEGLEKRVSALEAENKELYSRVVTLEKRLAIVEGGAGQQDVAPMSTQERGTAKDDDDDFDPFASDSEEDAVRQPPAVRKTTDKKPKKTVVAKSSLVLDVKPWDDETDIAEMESCVRGVTCDGLVWGASKILPVAFGIKKLQISCVVEDDKVGTDFLEEAITAFEDLVQSVDIVAFNKI